MALQPTGIPISLSDIKNELKVSNSPFSIRQAELGNYATINQSSTSKPDGNTPHSFSEWYSYDHDTFNSTGTVFKSYQRVGTSSLQCSDGFTGFFYEHNGDNDYPRVGDRVAFFGREDLPGISYIRLADPRTETVFFDGIVTDANGIVNGYYSC